MMYKKTSLHQLLFNVILLEFLGNKTQEKLAKSFGITYFFYTDHPLQIMH
jgi:hypothetical protein